ncbi:adenosine deaminase 2-A-like [Anopheles ziemanni]|uniref:adenosine deaminase 2-A-like n=1 Tax=Anopheles coustani TaxID=139045 RepID=UPI002659EC2B|nr:adenosine deaminase 2-A-like [Anopheles coustani]XP_058178448.1 adenosine deaminase 2-A-like [Anopheles ziemanni]
MVPNWRKTAGLRPSGSKYLVLLCFYLLSLVTMLEAKTIIERDVPPPRMTPEVYHRERAAMLLNEANEGLGGDIQLTANETLVNRYLMELKRAELTLGFENPYEFLPARHLFEVLDKINSSLLFHLIRKMPKGGVLHAHDTALASTEVIVKETYRDNLWQRGTISDGTVEFLFSRSRPASDGLGDWMEVKDRRSIDGAERYDESIRRYFSLYEEDPLKVYKSINDVWSRFTKMFFALDPIVTYRPVWESYFRAALQEFYDDNVMYLEFRGVLPQLYDLDGRKYGPEEVVELYINVTEEFKTTHPRFVGTKFIYAPLRIADNQTADQYLAIAERLHLQYGDYVVGFDLVGQEDLGRPLVDFADMLLTLPPSLNFVFHAGETNWHGMATDENLFDAILLGTKRIGHGYALQKHPSLLDAVKRSKICVEINPVSNQVLKLVDDLRNHPASVLFKSDFPLVVSSDDPSFWHATPLSHDFYMAFLGIASAHQDLRLLKKLALNSLEYSLMSSTEKSAAQALFEQLWNEFIDSMVGQIMANERT